MKFVREDESFFRSESRVTCPLLGTKVQIMIYVDGAEVRPNQIGAVEGFLKISKAGIADLNEPLFADYRNVRETVGEGPTIERSELVAKFVRWTDIVVPLQGRSSDRLIFVQGVPEWEQEHGVEMFFRNEKLIRVGRATGAFLGNAYLKWK